MKKLFFGSVLLLSLFAAPAFAGENCASMGGVCKDRCGDGEEALEGVFVDCDDKQECCKPGTGVPAPGGVSGKDQPPSPPPAPAKDAR